RGVTPALLFGNDLNRNGVLDPEEQQVGGDRNLGWSAYLTVYSREQNVDSQGNPRIYLNDSDTNTLYTNLSSVLSPALANYILIFRQYGANNPQGGAGGASGGASGGAAGGAGGAGAAASTQNKTTTTTQTKTTTPGRNDGDADDKAKTT